MLNHYECMLFCFMSSHREARFFKELQKNKEQFEKYSKREEILLASGWKSLSTSEELDIGKKHGYFGVAYEKKVPHNNTIEIVFAHRGTCFDERGNILADIAIAERKNPEILREAAFLYIEEIYNELNARHGLVITQITHTGFSLGGFIAGACVGLLSLPAGTVTQAITFDAPGIDALPIDKLSLKNKIINYVTQPNLVNTCNPHVGEVRQVSIFVSRKQSEEIKFKIHFSNLGFGAPISFPSDDCSLSKFKSTIEEMRKDEKRQKYALKAMKELKHTLTTHNLDKMITSLEKAGCLRYRSVFQWPSARNVVLYGNEPEVPSSMTHFGFDDLFTGLLSFIAIGVQGAKHIASSALWQITGGVIGMGHERNNQIYYSEQELLQQAKASSSFADTENQRPSLSNTQAHQLQGSPKPSMTPLRDNMNPRKQASLSKSVGQSINDETLGRERSKVKVGG